MGGFGIRVTASGTKAFVFDYRVNRRHRRLTSGRYPSWNATAARERAKKLKLQVDRGRDPLGEKEATRAAPTFAGVAAEYLERYASKKKSGFRDKQYLTRDVFPSWGSRKAADIKRRDVLELIERKAEQAPISANRLLARGGLRGALGPGKGSMTFPPLVREGGGDGSGGSRSALAAALRPQSWTTMAQAVAIIALKTSKSSQPLNKVGPFSFASQEICLKS